MEQKIKNIFQSLSSELFDIKDKVTVKEIKKLGLGENNLNYLVTINQDKKFIFRLNMKKDNLENSRVEFDFLNSISSLQIAPKPILINNNRHNQFKNSFLILEYIDGNALPEEYNMNKNELKILASQLAKLHTFNFDDLNVPKSLLSYDGFFINFDKKLKYINLKFKKYKITNISQNFESIIQKLKNTTYSLKKSEIETIIHGDLYTQNIIQVDNEYKFIDWEYGGLGDPAAEFTLIIDEPGNELNKSDKDFLLNEYFKLRKDNSLFERLNLYILLARFEQFLSAIEKIYSILDKDIDNEYINKENILNNIIDYFKYTVQRLEKTEIGNDIKNINFKKIFPKEFKSN
jgi:thiamine kinase-like enzyme